MRILFDFDSCFISNFSFSKAPVLLVFFSFLRLDFSLHFYIMLGSSFNSYLALATVFGAVISAPVNSTPPQTLRKFPDISFTSKLSY